MIMESKIRLFGVFLIFLALAAYVAAVPARPGLVNLTQPDGTVFLARLRGDEFAAWYESADGYSTVKNSGGWWVLARERDGRLIESFERADARSNLASFLPKHEHPARRATTGDGPVRGQSPERVESLLSGNVKVILLLINFTNNPRVNAGKYVGPYYENLIFNHSNNMSMASYYNETSYGIVNVTGVVGGPNKWYTSAYNMSYYGKDCSGAGSDDCFGQTYELICEAAALADADVDFTQYDADGNGFIDHILIVHAGCGQEDSTGCTMTDPLWSVRWSWTDLCTGMTFDGKRIRSGTILAEDSPMGTFGHESGHDFANLPDLYDIDYSSEGIGNWGMMSGGSWNGPWGYEGDVPAHFSAWSKYFMGWVTPTLVNSTLLDEEIAAVEYSPDVYQIMIPLGDTPKNPSSGGEKEYFLVENRQKVGFDSYIPGPGLLIWHIDDNQGRISSNYFNAYDSDRGVDLEEADQGTQSNLGLDGQAPTTGDRGVAADTWKANNAGFTDASVPNSKSKAGSASYINVTNISASGMVMTADFLGSGSSVLGPIILSSGNVTPQAGYADEAFNYTVSYKSSNNSAPAYVNVSIDGGVSRGMNASDAADTTYSDGKSYYHATLLLEGVHNFSFTASDGVNSNTTPTYTGPNATIRPGYLVASLISPNASINATKNLFFNATAQVSCIGGPCGNVTATLNSSAGVIPYGSGTPFYTVEPNPRLPANLSCLVNLSENASCNVSWNVNASGEHNTSRLFFAAFSSATGGNTTGTVNITIFSYTPIISDPDPANNTVLEPYTTYLTLSLRTHLTAVCRYANASGVAFDSMSRTFSQTNASYHATNITGLSDNQTLRVYVRCRSLEGYANSDDFLLRYEVSEPDVTLNEVNPAGDWTEVYNRGRTRVNLSSWTIEHAWSNSSHSFWATHSLSATLETYAVFGKTETNFSLNDAFGTVRLYDRYSVLVDNVSYANITGNESYGRETDGQLPWVILDSATPGIANGGYYSLEWPMFRQNPARTGETVTQILRYLIHKWNTTIGDRVRSSPAVSGGIVYASSWNGSITALNATSGAVLWTYGAGGFISSSPAISGGRLFIGTISVSSGTLLCLNASTGAHVWNRSFGGEIESSPLAYQGVVYIGVNDGRVYALNDSTGAQLWNVSISSPVRSSPALEGGLLYFGANDKRVYAVNATTGTRSWNYSSAGIVYSTPAVSDGLIVFGSYDNRVYALNASTGAHVWDYVTGGGVWSSPSVSGDRVFIGSNDRKVYAINRSTGAALWNVTTGFDVVSSPAVSHDLVFATSKDDIVWALSTANGSTLWTANLGADLISSPAIASGMLFVGADDGRVYAFGLYNDTTPPNVSLVWPGNGSTDSDGNMTLVYNVSDEGSNISSCSLTLDSVLNQTVGNITEYANQSFGVYNLVNGSYNWSVSCVDESVNSNVGASQNWFFNVSIESTRHFLEDLLSGWNLLSLPIEF